MKLELEHGSTLKNEDSMQIEQAMMAWPADESGYAILSETDTTYIQASGGRDDGFVVEYQAGSTDAHFRAKNQKLGIEEVVRAFQRYANGDAKWKEMFEWEAYEISAQRNKGCRSTAVLMISVLGAAAAAIASCG